MDPVALTFDCYGTLIDWQTGITRALAPLFPGVPPDDFIRAFGAIERTVEAGPYMSYREVCAEVTRRAAARFGVTLRRGEEDALADSIVLWPAFPDTPPALRRLKKKFRLCIVSNIDRDIFEEGTLPRLGEAFDAVVTADDVRSYKPGLAHFHEAAHRLDLGFDEILHVAESRFHDIEPANELGMRCVLVDRTRGGDSASGVGGGTPDLVVHSLGELADRLGA